MGGDRLSNLTQAIESIESRISSLMPAPAAAPAPVAQAPAPAPAPTPVQQVAAPPLAPVLAQAAPQPVMTQAAPPAAPPAADIGQLKTTISRLTDQINAQASQAVMARSAAQAVPAGAGAVGGSLSSLAAQVAERKRALAREAEATREAEAAEAAREAHRQAQQEAREAQRMRAAPPAAPQRNAAPQHDAAPQRNAAPQHDAFHDGPAQEPIVARPTSDVPRVSHSPELQPAIQPRRAQPRTPVVDEGALRELSAKLDTIKTDLTGVKRSVSRVRPDAEAEARAQAETRAEIERIASGIEALQAAPQFDSEGFDRLQDELAQLRQTMRADLRQTVRNEVGPVVEGAIETSMRGRDDKMGEAVEQLSRGLDAIGQATAEASNLSASQVMPKVEGLAAQFAELRLQVQDLPNTLTINRLEGQLREIADAVEKVEASGGPSHFELEGFAQIESRLDEITRALVAVGMGAEARAFDPAELDLSGLERLEGRMADLMDQVDRIGDAQAAAAEAARQAATAQAAAAEAAEIEQVSQQLSTLSQRLEEIERHAATSSRAAAEALSHRPDFSALETQLGALVRRLDDQADADMSAHQLASLEGQLVQLAQAMDGMGRAQQAMQGAVADAVGRPQTAIDFSPLEARLAQIEDRIDEAMDAPAPASNPGADVQVQRQVALQAAQAAAAQVAEVIGTGADAELLAELSRDMHAVQDALARGDHRQAETFDAVRQTLDAVGDRLATIEHGLAGSTQRLSTIETTIENGLAGSGERLATLERNLQNGLQNGLGGVPHPVPAQAFEPAPAMPPAAQLQPAQLQPVEAAQPTAGQPSAGQPISMIGGEADLPIEPGAPDIDDIVRRATERLNNSTATEDPHSYAEPRVADVAQPHSSSHDDDAPTDVVAAARRAVQATRAELDAVAEQNRSGGFGLPTGGLAEMIRKPLVALSAAVALAAVAFGGWYFMQDGMGDGRGVRQTARAPLATGMARDATPAHNRTAFASADGSAEAPLVREARTVPTVDVIAPRVDEPRLDEPRVDEPRVNEPRVETPGSEAPRVDAPSIDRPAAQPTRAAALPSINEAFDPATLPNAPLTDASAAEAPIDRAAPDRPQLASVSPDLASPGVERMEVPVAPTAEPNSETGPQPAPQTNRAITEPVPAGIVEPALREAAERGDRLALHEIGTRFSDGRGVKKDLEAAARWFELAAERGFAPAEYALGSLHEKGLGVDRDVARAVALYKSAAAKGNARAMHNLAVIQAMGALGEPDMASATRWFHEAASLGVKDSQFNLGILYGQGMGVPQNLAESFKWFSVAAGSGDSDAAAKRDEVAGVMDPETLKRAQKLAESWKSERPVASANAVAIPPAWGSASAPRPVAAAAPKPPKPAALPVAAVKRAQGLLNRIGYEIGRPDGKIGPRTSAALASFQRTWSLPSTGKLDRATLNALEDANT